MSEPAAPFRPSAATNLAVRCLGILVAAHGLYILAASLVDQVTAHRGTHLTDLAIDLPLLIGLSLVYLGGLLRRRKRTAWLVTIVAYAFYLGVSVTHLVERIGVHEATFQEWLRALILPGIIMALLFVFRGQYVVKSDIQGFRFAARFSLIMLLVAFLYGVAGFMLLDNSDFHHEISLGTAVHYTVDQFGITTGEQLQPHTRRAHLFVDSLSFVSLAAVLYAGFALFQPLRTRLTDPHLDRERMASLLKRYGAPSEEFFKLWPHDKQYFFDVSGRSGLAFHVSRGVALALSDPVGDPRQFKHLLSQFEELCFYNDWLPAFVHISDEHRDLYEQAGFELQKLGEEPFLDLNHFATAVADQKYFRQINNKFSKHGYTAELLAPPHHPAVIDRLGKISAEWLGQGGRDERGFAMGYFTPDYMQQCQVMVARDAAETIQAFINLVPAGFNHDEATYDLLRQGDGALGNVNDYLLMNTVTWLQAHGYKRFNMGLCALVGLEDADDENQRLIGRLFKFAYANGDRFYSFSGLHKFKAKYEPAWQDRYIAYRGGLRGFSRTMTALMRAMRV